MTDEKKETSALGLNELLGDVWQATRKRRIREQAESKKSFPSVERIRREKRKQVNDE